MFERALGRTFANLSTLVLVACVFTLPLHVIHAYVFRDALAVAEIGPEIRTFPEERQVRGVGKEDLDRERQTLLIVFALEALMLPLAYRAAKRVLAVDEAGGVPTVGDAYRHVRGSNTQRFEPGQIALAVGIGLVAGWLLWRIGGTLADMASADIAWAVTGIARATSVALFISICSGVAAAGSPSKTPVRAPEKLELY